MGEVAVVAEALRSFAGQAVPPFSCQVIVETRWPTAIITGRELPIGVDELVTVTCDGVLIIYGRSLSTAERRFVIAHAIAHLLFDLGECTRGGVIVDERREARADEFARELLVPDRALIRYVSIWPDGLFDREEYLDQVDHIAAVFHVPAGVINQRIHELARVAKS